MDLVPDDLTHREAVIMLKAVAHTWRGEMVLSGLPEEVANRVLGVTIRNARTLARGFPRLEVVK